MITKKVGLATALAAVIYIGLTTFSLAADDLCAPVKAMVSKYNATPKIRVVGADHLGAIYFTDLFVDTKQWWHSGSEPWHIKPRQYAPTDNIENCKHLGNETINGVETEVWTYDRPSYRQTDHIRMWISVDTRLPVKSAFKQVLPNKDVIEWYGTYSYGPDIKDPV